MGVSSRGEGTVLVRLFKAWKLNIHKKNSSISWKPDVPVFAQSVAPSVGPPPLVSRRERVVGFEETQNRRESRVERNKEGGRPSKEAPRGNGSQNVNLPLLLSSHIGRSENGQPLQSSLTSVYEGQALPNNVGGNLPPNGMFLSYNAQPFIPANLNVPNELMPMHVYPQQQPASFVNGQPMGFPPSPTHIQGPNGENLHWVEAREVATNDVSSDRIDSVKRPKKSSWDNNRGHKNKDREDCASKNTVSKSMAYKEGITFPPVTRVSNAPVIIEAAVFRRKVGRVYIDSGSTCEGIYEYCFEKLNPAIKATRVNTKTPFVGFSGKRSWSVREVPLEFTIGEHPLSRTEILNFVIVKSDSPHNMLLGRTTMQKMGIMVSTIHGAIKFHTKKGVRTLAEHFRKELQNLLRANADIFAWTHADMTRIPRTIMVDEKPFKTEHKLNEYSHIKPMKQNKGSLGPDRNAAACKEAKELTKVGILRKSKHQMWVANPVMVKKNDERWRIRVAKLAIELGEHNIVFLKRDERETPTDFLPEIPFDDSEKRVKEKEVSDPSNEWKLYTDRASSFDGTGAGLMLIDPAGKEYTYALRFEFETTNNEAEYETLLAGICISQEMEITKITIFLDSQLAVNQIKGAYAMKQLSIKSYLKKVNTTLKGFEGYTYKRSPQRRVLYTCQHN
uniref:Reverse transcriptase domain-containing protein n=1 Tax=Tanacetum cinerariifolium TaxID=118510 RepID=A0A6L2NZN2_TANCI|nr:reverse transcriptase domain-containing protein [Tanacetum cinerariifolium]